MLQQRTGQIIGSPEAIAFEQGWLSAEQLGQHADALMKSGYGKYLARLLKK